MAFARYVPAVPITCPGEVLELVARLRSDGHAAFLVGGCVRDALLGQEPLDWDVATSATPEQVEALFDRTVAVGRAFGVVLVVGRDGEYEIATFRGEGEYSDGRRPDRVFFASAEEDVRRRDFTINALLYDPSSGCVLDAVGGLADLRNGVVRTVGSPVERFGEDRLRLLRAVRFAARTGFALDPETLEAITALAPGVGGVSAERIGQELARMFTEGGGGGRALDLLDRTGLLAQVLPEVAALHGVEQPPEFHPEGDVFVHTSLMVAGLDAILGGGTDVPASDCVRVALEPDWGAEVLAWSVLLHDIGKPLTQTFSDRIRFHRHETVGAEMAAEVLTRLRRPRRVRDTVSEVIGAHMRFAQLPRMRRARQRRLTRDPAFVHHLILHWLDCCSSHRRLRVYEYGLSCWQRERERPAPLERLIGGSELIAMGMAPGPAMGRLLRELEDAQLEGEVNTREEALAWAASRLGPDTESPAPE